MTHSDDLPVGLMPTGAAFFGTCIVLMLVLDRFAVRSGHSRLGESVPTGRSKSEVIGGRVIDGLVAVASSPCLLAAAYIVAMAISNTLIYFTQANIILEATDKVSTRVGSLAQFDMQAQIATLLTQLVITTHLIRRFGVGLTTGHPGARELDRHWCTGSLAGLWRHRDFSGPSACDSLCSIAALASIVSRNCSLSSICHTSVGNIGMTSEASFRRPLRASINRLELIGPSKSLKGPTHRPACQSFRGWQLQVTLQRLE